MGQGWFNPTNCQLTEKVKGHFCPNLYQENRLLVTHHFSYENIFFIILWTVLQCHPFPQPSSQLCSCQKALMGTKMFSRFQNIFFTTPWNMSPQVSRFHFDHSVSLRRSQDQFLRQKIERFFCRDFSGEEFREKHYCPYNFVPINWLWSGFIFPALEHL